MLEKKEVISIVFLCAHHVCELFHVLGKKKKLAKKKIAKEKNISLSGLEHSNSC